MDLEKQIEELAFKLNSLKIDDDFEEFIFQINHLNANCYKYESKEDLMEDIKVLKYTLTNLKSKIDTIYHKLFDLTQGE